MFGNQCSESYLDSIKKLIIKTSRYVGNRIKIMKIKFFKKNAYKNGFELNFIGSKYNLRIVKYQFAFWKNYQPIFNYTW